MLQRLFGVVLLLIAGGCGTDVPQLPVVPAIGKVTFGGEPLVGATLVLAPDQGTVVATATSDVEGGFELVTGEQLGALPGSYKVIVSKHEYTPGKPIPGEHVESATISKLVTPKKYTALETTDLTLTVPPDGSSTLEVIIPK